MIATHDSWTATHPLYIGRYNDPEDAHMVIQEVHNRGAVDAVFAARHADLAPEIIAYVYDESDVDGPCFGYRTHGRSVRSESAWAEDWFYDDAESAIEAARRAVERAVKEYETEQALDACEI